MPIFPEYEYSEEIENDNISLFYGANIRVYYQGLYYIGSVRVNHYCNLEQFELWKEKYYVLDMFMKECYRYQHCVDVEKITNSLDNNGYSITFVLDEDQRTEKERLRDEGEEEYVSEG